jgi:hypothetical protein
MGMQNREISERQQLLKVSGKTGDISGIVSLSTNESMI